MKVKNIMSIRLFLFFIASLLLGACAEMGQNDKVSGNTFDPWVEAGGIPMGNISRVSISYWLEYASKDKVIDQYDNQDPVWTYIDRLNPNPQRALMIHWLPQTSPLIFDQQPGGRYSVVRKNNRYYTAYEYCLSAETVRSLPLLVYNYGIVSVNHKIGSTGQLYIKRYIPRNLEHDGSRIDLIYLEDIGLSGFRCVDLSEFDPADAPTAALLERINISADSSFDIIANF